jgi:hypothetical protein
MRKIGLGIAAALMIAGLATSANAATYILTESDPAAGLGAGPYGTVDVTASGGTLSFLVTLADGYDFNGNTNSTHHNFAFDLVGNPTVTFSNITPTSYGFASAGAISNDSPFGAFGYSLNCTACSNADAPPTWHGPLSFDVTDAAHDLTLNSLGYTSSTTYGNVIFAADVFGGPNGKTGNVGALNVPSGVPEPATWAMMLTGLFGAGMMLRRARKVAVTA